MIKYKTIKNTNNKFNNKKLIYLIILSINLYKFQVNNGRSMI